MFASLKKLLPLSAILVSLISVSAHAGLVATDWKASGDKLATLDDSTGLEWLDFSQTKGKSYNTVNSQLSTTYAGWRFPTYNEVVTLLNGYFSHDFTKGNYTGTDPRPLAQTFISLFGSTLYESSSQTAYGFYLNDQGQSRYMTMVRSHSTGYTPTQFNNNYFTQASVHPALAMFMVSDGGTTLSSINNPNLNINNPNAPVNDQPEPEPTPDPTPEPGGATDVFAPAGVAMFGFSMLLLGASRRKKATIAA